MCGITGIYCFEGTADKFSDKLSAAVNTLSKRGPDNENISFHNKIGLGHTRLSIIDTSNAANQPFIDNTGKYAIVFNGEFYNYKEYKNELIDDGIQFRSESDTEVLLYLLIKYGKSALEKINGCFAFAFCDFDKEKCLLARDRMGINPLYYYNDNEKLIFASEMKAILAYNIPKRLDYESLKIYFQLNYLPVNCSIIKNVNKLEPGSYIEIHNNNFTISKYYKIHQFNPNEKHDDYETAKTTIRNLLDCSVKRRLISDVPLGCFLSGGIDSTIITALASEHTKNLNTFSIGFKDEDYFDETEYSQIVAKRYHTNHTEFKVSNDDLLNDLESVLNYIDEPFADSSALAVNILSKLTRQKVTVALSGDGADELFAGYNKYAAHFNSKYSGTREKLISAMNPVWKVLPKSRNSKSANLIRQLDRFSEGYKLDSYDRYWFWASIGSEQYSKNLLKIAVDNNIYSLLKQKYKTDYNDFSEINSILYADMHLVLEGDMLTKVDRMSMANSLEVRTPFLDHSVVDYVFSLPASYKITATQRKKILKDSFSDLIPQEILNLPKHGFEVPLLKWFRNELWAMINNDLLSEKFIKEQGIFNYSIIEQLKTNIKSKNPSDSAAKIWALIVFQSWWKKYYI
ncbi:MAG TPA: asparagine synthase (glutamine-hydrolyzing) [Bacteroidales bacterium]|nr:asparagine synthase (glutamine-hydrolyzing) [Bacteroidales bacterium]